MTIFEIVDGGEVTGAGEGNITLKKEMDELEAFAKVISRSLGVANLERAVVTYKEKGIGVRYATGEESFAARGVEVEGEHPPSEIVEKLY